MYPLKIYRSFKVMRSRNIRLVLVLAILSMIGISVAQIYWVREAFNQEQDHFHRKVNAALNQVAQEILHLHSQKIECYRGNYENCNHLSSDGNARVAELFYDALR